MGAGMNDPANADELGLCLCHGCGQACELSSGAHRCTRCGAAIHRRKANAITRGWAFLLAALVFYIPANLLPVIHTQMLGSGSESTIGGGVLEFWEAGAWDIALMIFIASWVGQRVAAVRHCGWTYSASIRCRGAMPRWTLCGG